MDRYTHSLFCQAHHLVRGCSLRSVRSMHHRGQPKVHSPDPCAGEVQAACSLVDVVFVGLAVD